MSNVTDPKTFKVWVCWGENMDAKGFYEFATSEELEAFILGADEGVGWMDYSLFSSLEELNQELEAWEDGDAEEEEDNEE